SYSRVDACHTPTWGIDPRTGHPLPWQTAAVDIDVVGPLARSADDLALALSVMAGPDEIEAAGWQLRLTPPRQKRLRDFKVALMLDAPDIAVDRAVQDRLQTLADFLSRQKANVDDRARPDIDPREAFAVYPRLLRAAAFPDDQKGERDERTRMVDGTRVPVTDHLFWAGYSGAFYLPSTAAPCGFTPGGLPVGVQIVGPQYGDLRCLAFARLLEREFQAFVPPPGYV